MTDLYDWLYNLGLNSVYDDSLIKEALTHSSYKGMGYNVKDNERLEFLGDAVLDLVTAEYLYDNEMLNEDEMTELRKTYVSNQQLSIIFDQIGMKKYIYIARGFKLTNKVKAGFIEAFFGAIYKSLGYEACQQLWYNILEIMTNSYQSKHNNWHYDYYKQKNIKNAKSTLQEFCQAHKFENPEYVLIKKSGPDHKPTFLVEVRIKPGNNKLGFEEIFGIFSTDYKYYSARGKGTRKKLAELRAAEKLCEELDLDYQNSNNY
ncbi:MAG: ribonuclease III family protein [Promethearchaeia archaeon]